MMLVSHDPGEGSASIDLVHGSGWARNAAATSQVLEGSFGTVTLWFDDKGNVTEVWANH